MVPLTGLPALIAFFGANAFITFFYYTRYLHIDEDSYDRMELLKEGMMPSFGLFMVRTEHHNAIRKRFLSLFTIHNPYNINMCSPFYYHLHHL